MFNESKIFWLIIVILNVCWVTHFASANSNDSMIDVQIDQAVWNEQELALEVSGNISVADEKVVLSNADTGDVLADANAGDNRIWTISLPLSEQQVPCRIKAQSIDRATSLEVEDAPADCLSGADDSAY